MEHQRRGPSCRRGHVLAGSQGRAARLDSQHRGKNGRRTSLFPRDAIAVRRSAVSQAAGRDASRPRRLDSATAGKRGFVFAASARRRTAARFHSGGARLEVVRREGTKQGRCGTRSGGFLSPQAAATRRNRNIANHWRFADRKSIRLNSSHVAISYAVFCLKKKTKRK